MSLPDGWATAPIGDLCDLINGRAFKPRDWTEKGLPIIRIQNLNRPEADFNYFDQEVDQRFLVEPGELLFAWSGTPGTSFGAHIWNGPKAILNQHIFRVRFDEKEFDKAFFKLAINMKLSELIGKAHGGVGLAHVTKGTFERTEISIPPLPEQRRIVSRLDALTARISRARAELDVVPVLAKNMRLITLRAGVTGRLTEERRLSSPQEPIDQLLQRVPAPQQGRGGREATDKVMPGVAGLSVNNPGTPLPDGWRWVPLLRIARQETGHTPSRSQSSYWDGGVPWIGIRDAGAHHGRYITETMQTISKAGLANSSARLLPAGTVCLSRTASVGYVTIMARSMATSQDFATWTCTEALLPEYLMYALMAEGEDIRKFGMGSTHTTIYFPEIRALHIALPPLEEQQEIAARIGQVLARADRLEAEVARAHALLDRLEAAILAKAFRGELAPQDPTDEPTSVLLERVRAHRAAAREDKAGSRMRIRRDTTLPKGCTAASKQRQARAKITPPIS